MVLKPIPAAQPSSRSMVAGSQVSACHISNWLDAVLGKKFAPVRQPCSAYHALAFSALQRPSSKFQRMTPSSSTARAHAPPTRVVKETRRIATTVHLSQNVDMWLFLSYLLFESYRPQLHSVKLSYPPCSCDKKFSGGEERKHFMPIQLRHLHWHLSQSRLGTVSLKCAYCLPHPICNNRSPFPKRNFAVCSSV